MVDLEAGSKPQGDPSRPSFDDHRKAIADAQIGLNLDKSLSWSRKRALASYYDYQTDILDSMLDMDKVNKGQANFDDSEEQQLARRALNVSFGFNILLLGVRLALAIISGSLSMIIGTVDGVLDVLNSAMLYYATHAARRSNKYKYPVGRHRLEPLGVVVFAAIMGTAAWTVIIEGIRQLVIGSDTPTEELKSQWVIIGGTIFMVIIKSGLFLYCRRSKSVAAQAFANDHRNDAMFNSATLAGALLGAHVKWWLDPMMAIILALYITINWTRQGLAQIVTLVGVSAPPEVLQKLTYLVLNHRPEVLKEVDTVRAYTVGTDLLAEVDIVLPEDMTLKEAHDVGETLQIKLESVPGIARAYVHLDYESRHLPEH